MSPACWNLGTALVLALAACGAPAVSQQAGRTIDPHEASRIRMVSTQIAGRGIRDRAVLDAMRRVPRHLFVPEQLRDSAYGDTPLSIGHGQTISQPYIVALMTELVRPRAADRALEVGTGSGYQAAVLSPLVRELFTVEIVDALAREARERLAALGIENVAVRIGDGYAGWPEHAPFDVIVVTAAPDHVPPPLLEQLAPGGRLVIPVGPSGAGQVLRLIEKDAQGTLRTRDVAPVLFVPLVRKDDGRKR